MRSRVTMRLARSSRAAQSHGRRITLGVENVTCTREPKATICMHEKCTHLSRAPDVFLLAEIHIEIEVQVIVVQQEGGRFHGRRVRFLAVAQTPLGSLLPRAQYEHYIAVQHVCSFERESYGSRSSEVARGGLSAGRRAVVSTTLHCRVFVLYYTFSGSKRCVFFVRRPDF